MNRFPVYAFADEASPQVDGQIAAMLRNQLTGLEIRNVDGVNVSDVTPEHAREVRRKLDDAGLITWSIGSPLGKIGVNDPFEPHLDKLRRTLEIAEILGAKNIRMFSFYIPEDTDPADCRDEVFSRLGQMAQAAEGSGVVLCHENEKGIYGDIAPRCLEIHQAFPQIRAVFDPANFIQCGQDTLEGWKLLKPYVRYMHIKDALADGYVVPSGSGIGHVPEIAADFIASGGRDFTLEPHLKVFSGLDALERKGEHICVGDRVSYESNDAAFDAACVAFRSILANI